MTNHSAKCYERIRLYQASILGEIDSIKITYGAFGIFKEHLDNVEKYVNETLDVCEKCQLEEVRK